MTTQVKTRPRGRPDEGARDAILAAATQLFIEHDYAEVSTEDILRRAGVSRGALYHHFTGKLDLFRAVYEAAETRTIGRISQAALRADGPFDAMVRASRAYLREAETSIELRRIGIMQSRAVLGWEAWREVASRLGLAVAEAALSAAMDAGEIKRRDVATMSHVVLGALIEGATLVATAEKPGPVRMEAERLIVDLLEGLRT